MEYSQAIALNDMCKTIAMRLGHKHDLLKHFPDHLAHWDYKDKLIHINWRPTELTLDKFFGITEYGKGQSCERWGYIFGFGEDSPCGLWVKPYKYGLGYIGTEKVIPMDYIKSLYIAAHFI